MKSIAFTALAAFLNVVCVHAASAKQGPNIVFILTDDQDKLMGSLDYMPNVKEHLTDKGVIYERHYCTVALCCPSRVSLLTGRAAHNTNVTDIIPPYGGYTKFTEEGLNDNYLPVWLQNAGYSTYYAGKLMNGHATLNYNMPFAKGFNQSSFILDPGQYVYMNSTWQTGTGVPENFPGKHILDINNERAFAYLDDAAEKDVPFFLTIAPVAPHAQVIVDLDNPQIENRNISAPVPQAKWNTSFLDEKVPRTPNFNPDVASGGSWIRDLPQLDADTVAYNDAFYVARLQLLAGLDEMVGELVSRLNASGLLESTYIVYTTDNGFHIGQHRLQPGKSCPIEEDYIVPLIIRGPNVPAGKVVNTVTTHTDLAPTFFEMLGIDMRPEFDGAPIPVTNTQISSASEDSAQTEHIDMEYWGNLNARNEGNSGSTTPTNNTYKAARVIGTNYNVFYTVWCDNSHELYDMKADPYQMNDLLGASNASSDFTSSLSVSTVASSAVNSTARAPAPGSTQASVTHDIPQLVRRLDSLTMVLKSCKADACRSPWSVLHPQGDVQNLEDAMARKYDAFYASQPKASFSECQPGYILEAEGPQSVIPYSG
ncbi:alkaline-phosphatase-like protein [Mycena rosella]|uniref:Arylsulfatase n=1 Tax=Mycena rosella TaxID=1033263 RepID=A0AAD7BHZ4_MYCRO|nr:alkaline-phosphatase-like protein [Mycena rosella]